MNPLKLFVTALFLLPCSTIQAEDTFDPTAPYTFTDNKDRELEAVLIAINKTDVTIKRVDGQEFTLPMASFCDADQQYFKLWEADRTRTTNVTISANPQGAVGGTIRPAFMGIPVTGKRVVFVIDFSASMGRFSEEEAGMLAQGKTPDTTGWKNGGRISKHMMLRDILINSIRSLPADTEYQVIIFSASAWAHDEVKEEWLDEPALFSDRGVTLLQRLKSSGRISSKKGADLIIPRIEYLTASPENIARSSTILARTPTSLGTNWEHPLLTGLSLEPQPDELFFLTDGTVGDPAKALSLVDDYNKDTSTIIHGVSLMEPSAAELLNELAQKNGGQFTIVMKDGSIQQGEDYFKTE